MNIAVVYGHVPPDAPEDEQDVLVEVQAVLNTLSEMNFGAVGIPMFFDTQRLISDLQKARPDVIFNLVESIDGMGRFLYLAPTIYDYLQIPYTGAPTDAVYMTSNKLLAKQCMKAAGIPTAEWETAAKLTKNGIRFAPPYIIKSIWEHASIGLSEFSVFTESGKLADALKNLRNGGAWFAEQFIDGREFNLSMLGCPDGPRVLPPAEMTFRNFPAGKPKIVDYEAKWDELSHAYKNTVRTFEFPASDSGLLRQLSDIALQCWGTFDLHGYARVDFRVDADNTPFVLEVNVNPCISPDAGFFAACQQAGLNYRQVIEYILNDVNGV